MTYAKKNFNLAHVVHSKGFVDSCDQPDVHSLSRGSERTAKTSVRKLCED